MFLKKALSTPNSKGGDGKQGQERSSDSPSASRTKPFAESSRSSRSSLHDEGKLSTDSMPPLNNGGGAVRPSEGGGMRANGGGQERVVSVLQEQVAALVAKVGRLEKGLGRVPPSPAAASRGAAVQECESELSGPGFQQLQKQMVTLERQQQELRALSAHTPTHEQLVALQQQVDELRQQQPTLQAQGGTTGKEGSSDTHEQLVGLQQQVAELQLQLQQQKPALPPKGKTSGQEGSSDSTQTQQLLADLVQRMNAAEESIAQIRAMNSSKSPEGFVPRGEMMRAFSLLHDALAPKVKKILEEEGVNRQAGGAVDNKEIEQQITTVQEQGKREVEGLRREIEAFKISTSQAIAQAASHAQSSRRSSACEGEAGRLLAISSGACEKSVFGELARGFGPLSPRTSKKGLSPAKSDGAVADAEVRACKEMTAALEAELGLMRQLLDGMNINFMRRMDAMDDQLLELFDKAGALPGQISPRGGPPDGVANARREKQMADSIMENLLAEVGPGLETSLHDAEQALGIADETRAEMELVRGVVGKMGKKVEELSSGLVMVTSKLNNRLSKIEVAESERSSLVGTSRRGSESGETTMSASSRSLLDKWRRAAGAAQSVKDPRPQTLPSQGEVVDNSAGMGRSGSGSFFNQLPYTQPRAKRASSAFRDEGNGGLETILSGESAVYPPVPDNVSPLRARGTSASPRVSARDEQQYYAQEQAQVLQDLQARKMEAQQSVDLGRASAQLREIASSRLSNSGGRDAYSVTSTDPDSPLPSAFKADSVSGDQEQLRHQPQRPSPGISRHSSGRIRISEDGYSPASLPVKGGRIRFSEDGNHIAASQPQPQKASQQRSPKAPDEDVESPDLIDSALLRPSSVAGSVFQARSNASSAGNSPVHTGKPARPSSARLRGPHPALNKEGPPTAKFKTTAQMEAERKDLLRKL